jgi:hypothetical protein
MASHSLCPRDIGVIFCRFRKPVEGRSHSRVHVARSECEKWGAGGKTIDMEERLIRLNRNAKTGKRVLARNQNMQALIPCKVQPGMFEGEYAVEIQDGPAKISLFADKSLVKKRGDSFFLEVYLVPANGETAKRTVLLPTESFETGSRWLTVPPASLVAA